jgi:prophage regulatory protein
VATHHTSSFDNLPATGYMRQPQVLEVVPFSSATLWRKCKAGQFPKPVKLSERITAWNCGAVRLWLEQQAKQVAK